MASVTLTVILLVPDAVGIPLITPVDALRLNPAGSVPTSILQAIGNVPPVDVSV